MITIIISIDSIHRHHHHLYIDNRLSKEEVQESDQQRRARKSRPKQTNWFPFLPPIVITIILHILPIVITIILYILPIVITVILSSGRSSL